MADKIKGITVQIGGDTAPLSKALRQVDKEIRSTQANLKEVNKLLKLDPSNTNLLKEKQKLLAEQIGKTEQKLQGLKKAQQEAKQMLANGEIGQKEYDELEKQIGQCEDKLKDLREEQDKTEKAMKPSAEKIGKAFQEVGSKIEAAGKKLAPFSAAAAAGLGAAIKTTADFDSSMSEVAAISGATGEDFDALRSKAREMGEATKFSASEAADGFKYMAMAGWKTEDMLDGIDGVLNLAAASGEDLGTTSDIVTDALTAMGYSAKDAGHLADVMAAASSNANTNVSMMGETFKYAAAVGGSYGYTMEDIALATGLMANAGIKGSQAGTSLRSIMTRLATDAGASSKKLGALGTLTDRLGVAFYNADGTMRPFRDVIQDTRKAWKNLSKEEQANYANTIAGKNAMTGWLALMNSADDDFNKLAGAIDNSNGSAKGMADIMQDNLEGQLTILKSQLQELAISLGDVMMPVIRKIVGAVQGVVDWLNSLDEGTKETIVTIGLVVAAASPVLIILGKVVSAIGSIITIIPKIGAALSGIGGPIALAVAAIGGITALVVSHEKALEDLENEHATLSESAQKLKEEVGKEAEAWDGVTSSRGEAYKGIEEQANKEKALWEQLEKVVDATGKVKKGHEEEAALITGQLSEALGIEIELVEGQVKHYDVLKESIDEVIEKKKAEAFLTADQEAYTKALTHHDEVAMQVAQAEGDVYDQEKKVAKQQAKVDAIQKKLNEARDNGNDETGAMAATISDLRQQLQEEKAALRGDEKALAELKETQRTAKSTLDSYDATLKNHDRLQAAIASGSTEEMKKAQRDLVNNMITAETGTKESLERQTRRFMEEYGKMRETVQKTGSQAAKDASYNMHALVNDSIAELEKLDPKLAAEMKKELGTIDAQSQKWNDSGKKNADSLASGAKKGLQGVPGIIKDSLDLSSKAQTWGADVMKAFSAGIKANVDKASKAAAVAAQGVKNVLGFSEPEEGPLSDFHTYAPDMMKLFAQGINSSQWEVLNAVQGVAGNIRDALTGTTVTAQLDQKSLPLAPGVTLNIANFNNYSDSDIRELTNEIMETAASFAARKGAVFA